ncbi:Carbonyl reductase family member 4 [Sphaceloma murrayae]|uniref:Carbonyl reductase family member 4 n=1 Tax=Sphaceloma murrayae TaxID=2082308 RepID=A0A2K1QGN9_9PEZI|nr:Carbonyl reductase family member 4 [Sphaceloma murrayae]
MAKIPVDKSLWGNLREKTVLITGGANGIGKTAVRLFAEQGARVAIGDLDAVNGQALADELGSSVLFQKTDVTDWVSLRSIFTATKAKFGSIDHVIANAAMPERDPFLVTDSFDEDGELAAPDLRILDVNTGGVMRTAKLAVHFFGKNPTPGGSLVIVGSAASYFPAAPIMRYTATKHAALGLMRTLAYMSKSLHIRSNLIAPWMTETEFSSEVREMWGDLPINSMQEVAEAILVACADRSLNGRSLYVAKEIVDFEKPLHESRDAWMSAHQAELFDKGRVRLATAMGLSSEHYLE